MSKLILVMIFFLSCVLPASAQGHWVTYSPAESGFSVSMPEPVEHTFTKGVETCTSTNSGHVYQVYGAMRMRNEGELPALLNSFEQTIRQKMDTLPCVTVSRTLAAGPGWHGTRFIFETEGRPVLKSVIAVSESQPVVFALSGAAADPNLERFLGSFFIKPGTSFSTLAMQESRATVRSSVSSAGVVADGSAAAVGIQMGRFFGGLVWVFLAVCLIVAKYRRFMSHF